MATSKQLDGATPNGGVRSAMFFLNDKNELVDESVATAAKIEEYDKDGNIVHRTYMVRDKVQREIVNNED